MSNLFQDQIKGCVLKILERGAATMATLKAETHMHEVSVTLAIRDLQNAAIVEHGYLSPTGEWLDDWFPSEDPDDVVFDAWRICK